MTSNFARAYDPRTGQLTNWNMTNVPSGTAVLGPNGEHYRYTLSNIGNATNPNWRLTEWNSSKLNQLTAGQIGVSNWFLNGFYNGSLARMYDWNVSIPVLPGLSNPAIIAANYGDVILGRSTTFRGSISPSTWGTPDPYTFWAISLKPASIGSVLWIRNYTAPAGNITFVQGPVDFNSRVFTLYCVETLQWYGYNLDDGTPLWGPSDRATSDFDYYEPETTAVNAYGKIFFCNYGGVAFAIDMKTGKRLWTYGNDGSGNNTFAGLNDPWGHVPHQPAGVADGKLYLTSTEHSPNAPLYKGRYVICLNATTGQEIWRLMAYGETYGGLGAMCAIADGYFIFFNEYDHQVYCVGKGPSATTVEAPLTAITAGSSAVIQGRVTDIAAGTKQNAQAGRFPNGVPAVSDASQEGWMGYVYQQLPCPTNATGVDVTLDAIDPNGNFIHLDKVTSDTSSLFGYAWTAPDVPGKYTVIATFAGTESYWPSYAETTMVVSEAPAATLPPQYPVPADYTMTIVIATIVLLIAIAIVGLLLLRKRP
jgi:outer membrane protein assembly factor BamB